MFGGAQDRWPDPRVPGRHGRGHAEADLLTAATPAGISKALDVAVVHMPEERVDVLGGDVEVEDGIAHQRGRVLAHGADADE